MRSISSSDFDGAGIDLDTGARLGIGHHLRCAGNEHGLAVAGFQGACNYGFAFRPGE
ncbi:MAG: hypothetical protein H0W33_05465 [Gammaproteobacteria bacterium]|nr:hypothetical protein [Gammaproteobacteria bacterium]